jgi:hypothetical protein
MGGPGSGESTEESDKLLTTQVLALDVRQLRRDGTIVEGQTSLDLGHDVYIALEWRPCHLGGERPYFLCSNEDCERPRVLLLYYHNGRLLCRNCQDLAYPSQREISELGRAKRRTRKALQRLGVPSGLERDFQGKPHGMHHRTFLRLAEKYVEERLEWKRLTLAYNEACRVRNQHHLKAIREDDIDEPLFGDQT